jgi:quercetin dioxygenase-like cupin family protein
MRSRIVVCSLSVLATIGLVRAPSRGESPPARSMSATGTTAKALLLEKNEGERRVRRIPADSASVPMSMPSSEFMLKVSPRNNGSQHLVLGTEELAPRARIRKHRHLGQDEILLILTGIAHVRVGDLEQNVHAGGLVFLPSNTLIELENVGSEPIALVFLFSSPGFEDYLRCSSVPAGQKPTLITRDELKRCAHAGHVEYAGLQ